MFGGVEVSAGVGGVVDCVWVGTSGVGGYGVDFGVASFGVCGYA